MGGKTMEASDQFDKDDFCQVELNAGGLYFYVSLLMVWYAWVRKNREGKRTTSVA